MLSLDGPLRTAVAIIGAVRRLWPEAFAWRREPYEFVSDRPAIDLLTGSARVREAIDGGARLGDIAEPWEAEEEQFRSSRRPALLYA